MLIKIHDASKYPYNNEHSVDYEVYRESLDEKKTKKKYCENSRTI